MYTNADVLTKTKMDELREIVQEYHPSIVAVNEVMPKNMSTPRDPVEFQIKGFKPFPLNLDAKQGRGMIIYIHESLEKSVTEIEVKSKFNEVIAIEIRLLSGDKLAFYCCY